MDSETAPLEGIYKLWTWADRHRRQLLWAAAAAVIVGLGVYFYVWHKAASEQAAAEALAQLRPTPTASGPPIPVPAEGYLKVAGEYPGTQAAGRALLLAAGALFTDGKFAAARMQFDRFLREYPESPLRGEALYGSAGCLEATGKTSEAAAAYQALTDRYPTDSVVPRAKLALARTYEAQKQFDQAYDLYEQLSESERSGLVGLMADTRLEELKRTHPALAAPVSTNRTIIRPVVKTPATAPVKISVLAKTNAPASKTNHP